VAVDGISGSFVDLSWANAVSLSSLPYDSGLNAVTESANATAMLGNTSSTTSVKLRRMISLMATPSTISVNVTMHYVIDVSWANPSKRSVTGTISGSLSNIFNSLPLDSEWNGRWEGELRLDEMNCPLTNSCEIYFDADTSDGIIAQRFLSADHSLVEWADTNSIVTKAKQLLGTLLSFSLFVLLSSLKMSHTYRR